MPLDRRPVRGRSAPRRRATAQPATRDLPAGRDAVHRRDMLAESTAAVKSRDDAAGKFFTHVRTACSSIKISSNSSLICLIEL
jgi:hypothetical protein